MHEKLERPSLLSLMGKWTTRDVMLVCALIVFITAMVAVGTRGVMDYSDENEAIEAECAAKGMESLFITSQSVMKMCVTPFGVLVLPDVRRKDAGK